MTITLTYETERLINEALQSSHYKDADDVMQHALHALKQQEATGHQPMHRTPQEAAAHIRELRKGVTLGELTIKDLIHAGHKY